MQCSLNLEFIDANVSGEMAQLIISNQDRYVPTITTTDGIREIICQVPMYGDQFEECARNVQWTFRVENSAFEQLEAMTTEFADWHAKVTLYKIEFERFVRHSSTGEIGTSRARMNRTGKTTASKRIDKTYNEYKEFHEREVEAHICAAFMEMSGMENMDCK